MDTKKFLECTVHGSKNVRGVKTYIERMKMSGSSNSECGLEERSGDLKVVPLL